MTTAGYALCVYAGATPGLIGEAVIPPPARSKWNVLSDKGPLPAVRFDTSYRERRGVAWGWLHRSARQSLQRPRSPLRPTVSVRLRLDDTLAVNDADDCLVGTYRPQPATVGWATVPSMSR